MTKVCVVFVVKTISNSIKSVQKWKTSSGDRCTRCRKAEGLPWRSSGYDPAPRAGRLGPNPGQELRARTLQLTPAADKHTLLTAEK